MVQPLRVAIAGLGTVGAGVVRVLADNAATVAARAGRPIVVTAVSARDRSKDRGVDLSGMAWVDDPAALAGRNDVDLVVEVMGGSEGAARASVEAALAAGRHVVTANKALIAAHGAALSAQAEAGGAELRFEAAVAGGIPIVKALSEGLAANTIKRVIGVLNGTCNYILTEMEARHATYEDVLAEAQAKGYAEADPSFDVGGIDAAHKLAILAACAFGAEVDFDGVSIEGIERVSLADIEQARLMGYSIKLLGVAQFTAGGLEQRMQPCLVPESSAFGELSGVTNMVEIDGDFVGRTIYSGPGAGAGPTASAVVADLIDIARGFRRPAFGVPATALQNLPRAADGVTAAYYIRLELADSPGTLAQVAKVLGDCGVSIDRMRQQGHSGDSAPVLIVTHAAPRAALDRALDGIAALPVSAAPPVAIRIEAL